MRIARQRRIGIWVVLCNVLLCNFASVGRAQQSGGLVISPLNRTIQARSGAKNTLEFRVSNGLKTRTVIEVSLKDLTQDNGGAPILSESGSTPRSAAKWITLTQGKIVLEPGQDYLVRGTVAIPPNVAGSYHAAVTLALFSSEAPITTGSVASVVNQTILPIHVFINGTQKPAVELESADLKPALGNIMSAEGDGFLRGKWVLVPRVQNSGNSMVRLKGDIVITSNKGELVGRYQVSGGNPDGQAIFPGAMVSFPIFINSTLPDEQYPARISLRFQGITRIEGYSAPITLKPRVAGSTPNAQIGEVALGTIERTGLQALVEPRVVIGSVQPKSVRTQRITVTNLEDFPVSVTAAASGLAIDTDGEPIALPDVTTSTWMNIAPTNFRLGAQQSRVVSVRMNAPADTADRWGLLQFSMVSAAPNRSTLTTMARTAVLLRNASNIENGEAKVQGIALTRSGNGPIVSVTVTNPQARALAFASSALQLTGSDAPSASTSTAIPPAKANSANETASPTFTINSESNIVLLPNSTRRLDFQLPPNIQSGQYLGQMKLGGLAAATGAVKTDDFGVQFKLNLTSPVVPKTNSASTKKPLDSKTPAVKKTPAKSKPVAAPVKR